MTFTQFMTMKIQTDELEKIVATSADNINMQVTSTVNWRIVDVEVAATMAAETMSNTGQAGEVSADISKLRRDVLKQALASLAAFIGSVNYSGSFHVAAATQGGNKPKPSASAPPVALAQAEFSLGGAAAAAGEPIPPPSAEPLFLENPLYDTAKMDSAMAHANNVTRTYGVEIMSINVISASPVDSNLTKSLASGAVAAAEALQAETAARGQANAQRITAEAAAEAQLIEAKGSSESARIRAEGAKSAEVLRAEGEAEGIRIIGEAAQSTSGKEAMTQRIAEQYISQLADMAKSSKMMIVPDRPNDVASVVATALGLSQAMNKPAGTSR